LPKFQDYVPDWLAATAADDAPPAPKTREEAIAQNQTWLEDFAEAVDPADVAANNLQ